jgi:hypothetical protein
MLREFDRKLRRSPRARIRTRIILGLLVSNALRRRRAIGATFDLGRFLDAGEKTFDFKVRSGCRRWREIGLSLIGKAEAGYNAAGQVGSQRMLRRHIREQG